jgi:hypothetical protein
MKKTREDLESDFMKRKGEIEKEKFAHIQLLQEEHQQKENERDEGKTSYFKDLEVLLSLTIMAKILTLFPEKI